MHSYNRKKELPEEKKDYLVTLASETAAEVGHEFYHDRVPGACWGCELFQICMKNLSNNRFYRIIKVDEKIKHKCPKGRYESELMVVKVQECPLEVAFPARKAFEGILIKYHPQPCTEKECKYYENCNPPNNTIAKGTPVKCIKIIKKLNKECKFNKDLSLMIVKRNY